jgi:hypothetical protein
MEGGGERRASLLNGWGLKVEADGVRVVGSAGQVRELGAARERALGTSF